MTISYLLPCSCGREIPVERRQAGQVVRCRCGASLNVPTMQEMAALKRAEPEPGPPRPSRPWGVGQSVALLGAVIFLVGAGLVIYLVVARPRPREFPPPPSAEAIRRQTQALSPAKSLQAWRILQARSLQLPRAREQEYQDELFVWGLWMGVVVIIALVGVGLVVTPLVMQRRAAARRAGSAPGRREAGR